MYSLTFLFKQQCYNWHFLDKFYTVVKGIAWNLWAKNISQYVQQAWVLCCLYKLTFEKHPGKGGQTPQCWQQYFGILFAHFHLLSLWCIVFSLKLLLFLYNLTRMLLDLNLIYGLWLSGVIHRRGRMFFLGFFLVCLSSIVYLPQPIPLESNFWASNPNFGSRND